MKAKITLLPGDGIGPEVVAEARKVLDVIAGKFNHTFTFSEQLAGGIAIDQTGNPLPEETIGACLESDAVLLGAVGAPKQEQHQAVNDKRDPAQDRRRRKIVDHAPVANRQKQTENWVIEQGKIDLEAKSPQAKVLHRAAVIAAQNQPQQRAKC